MKMLVWLTQLGLTVALPPLGFILLAVWLRNHRGWGAWVIWVGILLGIVCAAEGLRTSLKTMEQMSRNKDQQAPPVSFDDHD